MTVRDLLRKLCSFDPNLKVVIGDADEGPDTKLEIQWVTGFDDHVEIRGDYTQRFEPNDLSDE